MIVLPFALGKVNPGLLTPIWPDSGVSRPDLFRGDPGKAIIAVLWAYDGWVNAAALAEEIRDPGRNIPRALIGGMLALIGLYLGMTLIYHMVLPLGEVSAAATSKGSPRIVAADFCEHLLGPWGQTMIALVVMTSTSISLNGNALSGPRAYFAMARDGLFPAGICRVHPRFQTPANAIIIQTAWAVMLMVAGTPSDPGRAAARPACPVRSWRPGRSFTSRPLYDVLFTYVIFGATIFYTLAIVSVFVLRAKRPDLPRPYKTWGYPFTPIVYTAASLLLLGSMLNEEPIESLAGLGIIAAGVPACWFFSRESRTPARRLT